MSVRIDSLPSNNAQTQGAQRRILLRQQSPQHLEECSTLIMDAVQRRPSSTSPAILVLGAGACTEVPLGGLVRNSDEVVLADFDLPSLRKACDELTSSALRKRMRLVECDITGGVSQHLNRLLARQPWSTLVSQGPQAVFDAAAACLEQCPILDPPELETIAPNAYGLVISSLVLSQLFSYPLLDVLDLVQRIAPHMLGEQERHRRYQETAQSFRTRVIQAHFHLLSNVVDIGGLIVLLTDIRGFVFDVYGSDHDAEHRRSIPLVPRTLPDMVRHNFTILEESHWEWLTDLPTKDKPGRGYEIAGYVLVSPTQDTAAPN